MSGNTRDTGICSQYICCSVTKLHLILQPYWLEHARPPYSSPAPWTCSHSCPSSRWCHPAISSSVGPFSSCPQSFPAPGSFPMSQFLTSGGQSIGVSASTSALPMNIQDWSPLGLTGLISLQSKGLSRVFSITTVWKHQFFGTQPFLQSNSHDSVIRIRLMASPTSQIRNPKIRNVGNHAQGHVTSMWMSLGV